MANTAPLLAGIAAEFDRVFQANMPKSAKIMEAKIHDQMAKASLLGLPTTEHEVALADIQTLALKDAKNSFCANWAKIESYVSYATAITKYIPWLAGPTIAFLGFFAAFKLTLLKVVCPTAVVPPAE